ncbi:MAG: bifunctional protein-serine/threonine kinase/phosphatase, partial [Hyphomicrobiales bacterium]|nr:bifunctional protein-serine/threonine kinase/phosphatase [Hyphomicrobiales bacterium]
MTGKLRVAIGQFSDRGHKETNQDFYGALVPEEPDLGLKGVAIAIADGISSSDVSEVAAESAVKSFLSDYYCT